MAIDTATVAAKRRKMLDLHCHVLPGMDDGCQTVEESLAVLHVLKQQRVDTVVATPHFHASQESVAEFLQRREQSYAQVKAQMAEDLPVIKLGAEVRYYNGIRRLDGLSRLRIQDSPLFLLEMPLGRWTEFTLREVVELADACGGQLVLAHIERYWKDQPKRTWLRLLDAGILMQVNAPYFADCRTRRKACKLLKNYSIHFLGSDSHNLSDRAPRLGEAEAAIRRKMGEDFTDQWIAYGERWFEL